jgi:ATP synthase protein I
MTWRAMSGTDSAPAGQTGPSAPSPDDGPGAEENQGWSIFSYLIAGMVAYGLLGWLVAWLTHIPVLLPVGALVGLVFAIGGVVWKYGRHQ